MKTIDVLGKPCPFPVIEAKKALRDGSEACILVKVDNTIAVENLRRMAEDLGCRFSFAEARQGVYDVTISREGAGTLDEKGTAAPGRMAVIISKNKMGEGSDELGKILIKGFIFSLTELEPPPAYVVFLNSGVFLTSYGSNAIDDLRKLSTKDTQILSCGTCVNYYELQEKLAVGVIANMYEITEIMASAGQIVNI